MRLPTILVPIAVLAACAPLSGQAVTASGAPAFDRASTAGALGLSSTVRFRIDTAMLVEGPSAGSITVLDLRDELPEPGMGVEEAVGQHGFFLDRLACLSANELAPVYEIARLAAASSAVCESRDDHRTDIFLSSVERGPSNRWLHTAYGITNDLVWAVEVTRDTSGTVVHRDLIGAIRLQSSR